MAGIYKKIICFLMSVTLLMSFSPAFAESETNDDYFLHAFGILSQLGIADEGAASEISDDDKISRGDFLRAVNKITNLTPPSDDVGKIFADVNKLNKYYADVRLGCSLGLIAGTPDGKFLPNDKIDFFAAVKIIMCLLGWDEVCKAEGGYPSGYIQKANEAELFKRITVSDGKITKKLAYKLIYNALNAKMLVAGNISQKAIRYENSGIKVLEYYRGIKRIEGKLMGNYALSMTKSAELKDNEIIIGDTVFRTELQTDNLLGRVCECWYDAEENAAAISEAFAKNKSIEIASSEIIGFSDNVYRYMPGKSTVMLTARLSQQADICYNGRMLSPYSNSCMLPQNGSVTLVDNDADGIYDSVIVYSYIDICVKGTNADTKTVFDLYGTSGICLNDYEAYSFRDELGNLLDVTDLIKFDVICVAESCDKKYAEIISSSREIGGRVQETVNGKSIVINGTEFAVADCAVQAVSGISPGDDCLFILDMAGQIASVQKADEIFSFGYIMGFSESKSLAGKTEIKIFGYDANIYYYKVDYSIILDGNTTPAEKLYGKLNERYSQNRGVVSFRKNGDKLLELDTMLDEYYKGFDDEGNKIQTLRWRPNAGVFGGKVPVNAKTTVFSVPAPGIAAEDGMYTVGKLSDMFISDNSYAMNAYRKDRERHFADVLVIYTQDSEHTVSNTTAAAVVSEITTAIADDGCVGYKIKAYSGKKAAEYFVADKTLVDNLPSLDETGYHTLECGDIIRVARGFYNRVTQIELIYERESGLIKGKSSLGNGGGSTAFRAVKAKAYSRDGENLFITQANLKGTSTEVPMTEIESFSVDKFYSAWKCVYEKGEYVLKPAVAADVFDYKSVGENCSELVITTSWGDPRLLLIYQSNN